MQSKGACDACLNGTPHHLEAVGQKIEKQPGFGRGYQSAQLDFKQCLSCGSLWAFIVEHGPGRTDTFKVCLTRGFV